MALSNELIGRVLGGRYLLRAIIGTGASARVYLADDTTLRRSVAVKVLHESLAHDDVFLRRFRKEAQAAAALNHPNVLAVYDWGQDDVPYIVTEYLAGGSLRSMLDAGHRLSVAQTLLVGLEAARGLDYAHRRGLVHRDIKPANLLFDDERRLRIADFGLARALAEAGVTEPGGSMVGTIRYASPEQATGKTLTGKTDVYALGLVLIECVTGVVPFAADTGLGSLLSRVDQQVPVPAALGPLRAPLERAGRPDPDDRPDAEELAISLMAAAAELTRPDPLPIVGALAADATTIADRTMLQPLGDDLALGGSVRAGSAGEQDVGPAVSVPAERPDPSDTAGSGVASAEVAAIELGDGLDATAAFASGSGARPSGGTDPTRTMVTTVEPTRVIDRPPFTGPAPAGAEPHRRRWPWVLLGILVLAAAVAGGVYAYLENRTISHVMPELIGQDRSVLVDLAAKNKWVLGTPDERRSDEFPTAGQIIDVLPPAGMKVAEGATVEYTVSLGPEPVTIPKLVGLTLDEARSALQAVRLDLGAPVKAYDEDVGPGLILKVETVGASAAPGTEIIVKVSDGPQPRTVPAELVGKPEAEVNAKLAELRLKAVRAEEFSETVAAGSVTRFEPVAGSPMPRDSEVKVFVSKGREPKPVPPTAGLNVLEAAARLREAGFVPGDTRGAADGRVIATDPPAGTLRVPGSTVDIVTGSR